MKGDKSPTEICVDSKALKSTRLVDYTQSIHLQVKSVGITFMKRKSGETVTQQWEHDAHKTYLLYSEMFVVILILIYCITASFY